MTASPAHQESLFRRWLMAFAGCVVVVLLSMAYLDQPVANFVHTHVTSTPVSNSLVRSFDALAPLAALLLVLQLWVGIGAMRGAAAPAWARTPLLAAWSSSWTLAVVLALKHAFGRAEVYPTYIVLHSTAFRWFHASLDYQAFPSGTTAVAGAILTVVWHGLPRVRALTVIGLIGTAAALVMTNSHWLSDTIAGGFIGVTVGWMTVLMLDRRGAA